MTRRSAKFLHPLFALLAGLGIGLANGADRASPVIVNGVALSLETLMALQRIYIEQACRSVVAPGHYWVNAHGLGGFEGGPVTFNLALCGAPPGQRSGGSSTRTFCDPDGSCRSTGILGSILTVPR